VRLPSILTSQETPDFRDVSRKMAAQRTAASMNA
jgi:hypothetical protein